jgi:DNA-binding transcriptional regulator YdaS (Cro superfamily)
VAVTLIEYINERFCGSQRAFAESQGVMPPQVTQWLKKDFIVVNDTLYSPRRELIY